MVIEKDAVVAGRYRLIEQVGSGAMGVVWKAQDERLGRTVAIKRLIVRYALSESVTEEVRKRAMREARIAARLQHRNAIALFDVAEHEGDPILVMEFLPSKSLSAVLEERGTLPPNEVAEIGAQVAEAIAAAHAVGIAHRDIKPGNILLAENGTVKITDFGISRALDDGTVTTQTGMLAGTPAYLAPEIARGGDSSRASDVFSLGSTLYHAVEGRPPFGTNTNPLALLHAVASGNVPAPRNAGPLEPALMSLMRVEPGDRPTMKEAAESLAAMSTQPIPVPVVTPQKAAQKAAQKPPPATPPRPVPVPAASQTPPTPPQPMEAMPTAAFRKPEQQARTGPSKRNMAIVGVVALLVMVGTVFTVLMLNSDDGAGGNATGTGGTTTTREAGPPQNGEGNGGTTTDEEPPADETSPPPPSPQGQATQVAPPAGVFIDYRQAGQTVIDYYNTGRSLGERWSLLSPFAQAQFGSQDAFNQYWAQFPNVSSEDAHVDRETEDNAREVSVTVNYAQGNTVRKTVRVTMIDGQLRIDSETR